MARCGTKCSHHKHTTCPAQILFFWSCAASPSPTYLTTPAQILLQLSKSLIEISQDGFSSTHNARITCLTSSFHWSQPALRQTCFTSPPGTSTMNHVGYSTVRRARRAQLHSESFTLLPHTHPPLLTPWQSAQNLPSSPPAPYSAVPQPYTGVRSATDAWDGSHRPSLRFSLFAPPEVVADRTTFISICT
jgi:hypothetical protein